MINNPKTEFNNTMKSFANHKAVWPVLFLVFCNLLFLAIVNEAIHSGPQPALIGMLGVLLAIIFFTVFLIKTIVYGNRRNS